MNLFRNEVFEAQRNAWIGTIQIAPPRPAWRSLAVATVSLAAVALFLVLAHYTRREPVTGRLVSSKGLIEIAPPVAGRVMQVLVKEGETVAAGQTLLVLSTEKSSVRLGPTQAWILTQLHKEKSLLGSDRGAQVNTYEAHEHSLRAERETLRQQGEQLDAEIAVQEKRTESAKALYDGWGVAAEKGVVPKLQLLEQKDRYLESQSRLQELRRQRPQIRQQMAQVQSQIDRLPAERTLAVNDIDRRAGEIERTAALAEAERASVLTAPEAGRVTNLMAFVGQAVNEHETLLSVLPDQAILQAELWVPSRAVGLIGVGEPVSLRYSAYPYAKYGQHMGTIEAIAGSAAPMRAQGASAGSEEMRYRVIVGIDSQSIRVGDADVALKPGMAVDADVALDRRRILDFLLEPLHRAALPFRRDPEGHRT